jgi:hypothetical protein
MKRSMCHEIGYSNIVPEGISTHFASSEILTPENQRQIANFEECWPHRASRLPSGAATWTTRLEC